MSNSLSSLPAELVARAVAPLANVEELARLLGVCRLFRSVIVEDALRQRAMSRGLVLPGLLPDGYHSWKEALIWWERRDRCTPRATIATAVDHTAFVDCEARVLMCGSEESSSEAGMLGQAAEWQSGGKRLLTPLVVPGLALVRVHSVALGACHSLVLSDGGALYSFGGGQHGRLGHGDFLTQATPRPIDALHGARIAAVSAGEAHSLAVSADGRVFSFGAAGLGRLGLGIWDVKDQHTPQVIDSWMGPTLRAVSIRGVAAGTAHSLAVDADGSCFAFGSNSHGQLGVGANTNLTERVLGVDPGYLSASWRPQRIEGLAAILMVAAGEAHSIAVGMGGECYSWGAGSMGRLGHADTEDQRAPKIIEALAGQRIHRAAASFYHSLVVTADGKCFSFGSSGPYDRLGHPRYADDSHQTLLVPRAIEALRHVKVIHICAGRYHGLAEGADGVVYTWGANVSGQLGHGGDAFEQQQARGMRGQAVAVLEGLRCAAHVLS